MMMLGLPVATEKKLSFCWMSITVRTSISAIIPMSQYFKIPIKSTSGFPKNRNCLSDYPIITTKKYCCHFVIFQISVQKQRRRRKQQEPDEEKLFLAYFPQPADKVSKPRPGKLLPPHFQSGKKDEETISCFLFHAWLRFLIKDESFPCLPGGGFRDGKLCY